MQPRQCDICRGEAEVWMVCGCMQMHVATERLCRACARRREQRMISGALTCYRGLSGHPIVDWRFSPIEKGDSTGELEVAP